MRLGQLLVSLALGIAAACEDPTLLIGARPTEEPGEQEPVAPDDDVDTTVQPARPTPAAEPIDAALAPAPVSDAGRADAARPAEPEPDEPDPIPDFRPDDDPPPPPRSRFAYRCRGDRECARVRGVCDRGWCVQCRSFLDCPAFSACTAERICVRQR